MKKIIYSLVIMIAAGSLFTACINQEEPEGLYKIRDAKAAYINALANLRKADEALKTAEAGVQDAIAAIKRAIADKIAAEAKAQQIENDYQKALHDGTINDEIQKAHDEYLREKALAEKQHEAEMKNAEAALKEAEKRLNDAVRDLDFASKSLNENETKALASAAALYYASIEAISYQKLVIIEKEYALEKLLSEKKAAEAEGTDIKTEEEAKEAIAKIDEEIEALQAEIDELTEALEEVGEMKDCEEADNWQELADTLENEIAGKKVDQANHIVEVADYYVSDIHDNVAKYNKFVEEWVKENAKAAADTTKEGKEAFEAELADFVGTHMDKNNKPVVNFTYAALQAGVLPEDKDFDGNKTAEIEAYVKSLAAVFAKVDVFGNLTNVWDPELVGGEMLTKAQEVFADLLNKAYDWETDDTEDQIRHLEIRKQAAEAAAIAAAKAADFKATYGDVDIDAAEYTEWKKLHDALEEAYNAYVDELKDQKQELEDEVGALENLKSDIEALDFSFANYWDYKIKVAERNVETAYLRLAALEKAHDYAKTNYNHILDYLLNTVGVDFVDFSGFIPEDITSVEQLLGFLKMLEEGYID